MVWYQGVYQDLDNHGTTGAFWYDTFLPSFCASSCKLNATSLPSPDSEAHGTMVERGDVNSIQFCKGGTSHSRLPSPRCPTLGQLGSRDTLLPYLNRHQHQTHHRKEHIGLMLCLVPSSCTIINAVKKLEHMVDFTAMAEAQRNDKEMAAYRTAISGLVLQDIQFGSSDTMLLCNVSTCQP